METLTKGRIGILNLSGPFRFVEACKIKKTLYSSVYWHGELCRESFLALDKRQFGVCTLPTRLSHCNSTKNLLPIDTSMKPQLSVFRITTLSPRYISRSCQDTTKWVPSSRKMWRVSTSVRVLHPDRVKDGVGASKRNWSVASSSVYI